MSTRPGDEASPRYLGRRHVLVETEGRVELRDRLNENAPVRYAADDRGWAAAIADLRRLDGVVFDPASGRVIGADAIRSGRGGRGRGRAWLAAAAVLVAMAVLIPTVLRRTVLERTDAAATPLTDAQIVDRAVRGTMLVVVYEGQPVGLGSGWMYDARRKILVTNAHVVDTGTRFRAGFPGSLTLATLVARAPCADLAVLRLGASLGYQTLELGPDEPPDEGDRVVAVGYPPLIPSVPEATQIRSTVGTVSHSNVDELGGLEGLIEHSAALDPGNSGGPLVDTLGRVVGVNVGVDIIDRSLGYAIPARVVRDLVPAMLAGEDVCAA